MSKSTTKPSRPATGTKPTPKRPWIPKRFSSNMLAFLAIGICSVFIIKVCPAAGAFGQCAALYLFANDGKVSGRMSGDVKMRNGRSRAMAFPALVRNAYTTAVRSSFADFSSGFRGLTATQIDAWNNFSYKHSDRFANTINVKGKMAYIGINQNLTDIGQTPITDPPSLVGVHEQTLTTPIVFNSSGTLTLTASPYAATDSYIVFATASLSPGVRRPAKSAFRVIGVDPTITTGVMDISAQYTTKFGNPVAGAQVFVYTVPVDKTTGEKGVGSNILGGIVT